MRDDEVIKAHCEREHEAGGDAGHDVRKYDAEKGLKRCGAEVKRCFEGCLLGGPDFRHDRQDHVRDIKGNVADKDGLKAERNPERDEAEHHRDAGHDVCV